MNTNASTRATAIAKAVARPLQLGRAWAGRERRRQPRMPAIAMNRFFLLAVAAAVLVVVLALAGLAIFAPSPVPHHVATVLPNDRFQPVH
jgi:hypothetical protein